MYKTLLVPVDVAEIEAARPALGRAVRLAELAEGTVRLLYVRSILPVTYMEFVPPSFDAEQQRDAEERLAALAAEIELPPERISTAVRLGSVYNEILREAEAIAADLIVVGSHRPRMASFLLGSNAVQIVRHAAMSVLIVRGPPATA